MKAFSEKNDHQTAPLKPGSTVALVAPAGRVKPEDTARAKEWLLGLGFQIMEGAHLYDDFFHGYHYASRPEKRLIDFQEAISDPNVDAIWCARGGYGSIYLLDQLDLNPLLEKPKWMCGYSDITVLHQFFQSKGLLSLHSVTAKPLAVPYSKRTYDGLQKVWLGKWPNLTWPTCAGNKEGKVTGRLIGGNLSMLYSLIGTPYLSRAKNDILFIEDWNENWYALDRMLMSMLKAGYFDGLSAIVVGNFTRMDVKEDNLDFNTSFDPVSYDVIHQICTNLRIPLAFGFPAGHTGDNMPLVLGATVELKVTKSDSSLTYLH